VYLAGGCFWGIEDLVRKQSGVVDTEVGYTGGDNDHPTYRNHPGHAEALMITFDEDQTNYEAILDFFFRVHDPTTLNRQGNDVGSSYRSAIFYQSDEERQTAQKIINMVNDSDLYDSDVVTTLEPFEQWWPAEDYHQDYLQKNPGGYTCHFVRLEQPITDQATST